MLGGLNTCLHTRPANTGSQTHMLILWCLHIHGVHTPMFVYSTMPIYTFHILAHVPKFACPSLHTCIHVCICPLTHVCIHTHSCKLTMLTPLIHAHTHTHTEPTVYTLIISCTHIYTLACSPVLEHTNHAKPSHDPAMGYFHLFPHHPLLLLTPSHFSGPITLPSWKFLVL